MAIQYKRIIKQIMGPDAADNGFAPAKLDPPGLSKRMLANYEKDFDEEYSQGYSIELDTMSSELELQSCGLWETRKFDRDDEDSFRSVINEFAQIMRDKGFSLLEEYAAKPRFSIKDNQFLLNNYEQLSEQFCREKGIDIKMPFLDKLYMIDSLVVSCRGKDFEEVKEELIKISAFYTTTLLEREETTQYYGDEYSVLIRGKLGALNVLVIILAWWLNEKNENYVKKTCTLILAPDKLNAIDWNK